MVVPSYRSRLFCCGRNLPCHARVSGWTLTAGGDRRRDRMEQADMRTAPRAVLLELEFWAPVAEAPTYDISTCGRVRRGDQLIECWPNKKGYHLVSLEIAGRDQLRY